MEEPTQGARAMLFSAGRYLRRAINSELNQLSYNRQTLTALGVPEVFQIELTNHCPMACVMCPRTHGMTRGLGYMDEDLFCHVVREISPFSSRIFLHHFGDSLVHPRLADFIRYASRHNVKTYLSTNPILLTEERIRGLVDSGLHELVISLDGVSSETSATIRGRAANNVEEAERKILALLKYRQEQDSKTPYLIMQFVRQKLNRHEADAWVAKWTAVQGIDAVKVKTYMTWDGHDDRINALRVNPEPTTGDLVCDKPWTSVTVLWDGRVVPCCFDYDGLYVLGNLQEQSLLEIWNGERIRSLRQAHRDGNLRGVRLCARCTDKEGYPVTKWYYPLNRLFSRRAPLGDEDDIAAR